MNKDNQKLIIEEHQKLIIEEHLFVLRKERQKWTFHEQELSQQIEREAIQIAFDELRNELQREINSIKNAQIRNDRESCSLIELKAKLPERAKDSRIQELAKRKVIVERRKSEKRARDIEEFISGLLSNTLSADQRIEITKLFNENPPPKEFYSPLNDLALLTSIQPALQEAPKPALPEAQPAVHQVKPTEIEVNAKKDKKQSPRFGTTLYPKAAEIITQGFEQGLTRQKIIASIDGLQNGEKPISGDAIGKFYTRMVNNLKKRTSKDK